MLRSESALATNAVASLTLTSLRSTQSGCLCHRKPRPTGSGGVEAMVWRMGFILAAEVCAGHELSGGA